MVFCKLHGDLSCCLLHWIFVWILYFAFVPGFCIWTWILHICFLVLPVVITHLLELPVDIPFVLPTFRYCQLVYNWFAVGIPSCHIVCTRFQLVYSCYCYCQSPFEQANQFANNALSFSGTISAAQVDLVISDQSHALPKPMSIISLVIELNSSSF